MEVGACRIRSWIFPRKRECFGVPTVRIVASTRELNQCLQKRFYEMTGLGGNGRRCVG